MVFDGEPSNGIPPPKKYIFEKCWLWPWPMNPWPWKYY